MKLKPSKRSAWTPFIFGFVFATVTTSIVWLVITYTTDFRSAESDAALRAAFNEAIAIETETSGISEGVFASPYPFDTDDLLSQSFEREFQRLKNYPYYFAVIRLNGDPHFIVTDRNGKQVATDHLSERIPR